MKKITALAAKDLRLLLRDRAGFFFTLIFPLLIAVFFGTIFGGGGGGRSAVPILVVDEDGTEASRAFITTLVEAPEIDVAVVTREEAVETVRLGKRVAYVVLKGGFGEATQHIFWGEPPTVELGTDPARRADAAMIEGILTKYRAEDMQDALSSQQRQMQNIDHARSSLGQSADLPPTVRSNLEALLDNLERLWGDENMAGSDTGTMGQQGGFQPLVVERADVVVQRYGPKSAYAITFPQGIIWGIIGVSAAFGLSIVTERTRGTLLRLQTAPISRTYILAGKALACFLATTAIAVGLFIFARFVFSLRPGSVPLLALAILSTSVGFVGIMMLLSVTGRTEQAAGSISWAILLVMSMLGGGMIPLFFMPSWMRTISHVSPVKWSILAMEGAIWRQFSVNEMALPCGILIGIGLICFTIGARAFDWIEQR